MLMMLIQYQTLIMSTLDRVLFSLAEHGGDDGIAAWAREVLSRVCPSLGQSLRAIEPP